MIDLEHAGVRLWPGTTSAHADVSALQAIRRRIARSSRLNSELSTTLIRN